MGLISNFDINVNFWDTNPTFKVLGEFAKFYRSDTSKDKRASSKVMWAVCLYVDTSQENHLRKSSNEEKKKMITEEWIRDNDFKWKKYDHLVEEYKKTQLSPSKRSLLFLKEKMEEREAFLKITPYTLENAKDLDSIVANTDKIFTMITKLEDQVEKEENMEGGGALRGGRIESAGERKVL